MKLIKQIFILLVFLISIKISSTNDCENIQRSYLSPPKSVYISISKLNSPAIIQCVSLGNNSKSYTIFKDDVYDEIELIMVSSFLNKILARSTKLMQDLIIIKTNNTIIKGDEDIKWDNNLSQIYLTPYYNLSDNICSNSSFLNDDFGVVNDRLTTIAISGDGNFTILSDEIASNEGFQTSFETNFKTNRTALESFKSSIDFENTIHYSLINNNNSIYIIKTNYKNKDKSIAVKPSTYLIGRNDILPNIEFKSMGIYGYNDTIIIGGLDNKSNSTKIYSIILNDEYNPGTANRSILLFEKNYQVSDFIRTPNSKYLLMYSKNNQTVTFYNIQDKKIQDFYNVSIEIPDGYYIIDMLSSVNETFLYENSNKGVKTGSDDNKINKLNETSTIVIIVVVSVSGCLLLVLGTVIFIKKRRNSRNSFKKLDKDREAQSNYPSDNITILLHQYK